MWTQGESHSGALAVAMLFPVKDEWRIELTAPL